MGRASYRIVPHQGGWGVDQNGTIAGPYGSKEAAFEAAIGPAMNAIKEGEEVELSVPGSDGRHSVLGTRDR
jgi:Uncharacterized protein conserved in bacteria (DUF2188)